MSINRAPDANNDTVSTSEDGRLVIAASRLLANDRDADCDRLRITSVGCASNCRVSIDCNGNIVIIPAANFSGVATFQYTVSDGRGGFDTATVSVNVSAVADAASLTVSNAHGTADTAIALNIGAALKDTDGSESLKIVISGVPGGATLNNGIKNADGSWTLTKSQLAGLTITPPTGSDADFNLTVRAIATESSNGNVATVTKTLKVTVDPAEDEPVLIVADATGCEDLAIALSINAENADTIVISGVPAGATLSAGTLNSNGTWSLTAAQLVGLTITPPTNSDNDFDLTVTITGRGDCDDDDDHGHGNEGVGNGEDPPPPGHSYNWNDGPGTSPGNPGSRGGANRHGEGGRHGRGGRDRDEDDDDHDHGHGNDGRDDDDDNCDDDCEIITITKTLHVSVKAVADMPALVVADAEGSAAAPIALSIAAALADTDGSESLLVRVSGLPVGATLSAGTQSAGVWTLTAADLVGLTLNAPDGLTGDFTLVIEAVSTEAENLDAESQTASLNLHLVTLGPVARNDANSVSEDGAPATGNVLLNDFGGPLSVVAPGTQAGTYGTLTQNADGSYVYTQGTAAQALAAGESFTETFSYQAQDGLGELSDVATLTITVTGVNDGPVAADDTAVVREDLALFASGNMIAGPGAGTDVDVDHGAVLSLVPASVGTFSLNYGSLIVAANGSYTYNLNNSLQVVNNLHDDEFLSDNFTYTVRDQFGASSTATLEVKIEGHNDTPFGEPDAAMTLTSDPVVIAVLGNDGDFESDGLTISIWQQPGHGEATVNPDGTITYIAADNYHTPPGEPEVFYYVLTDSFGAASAPIRVEVTVLANPNPNTAPIAEDTTYGVDEDTVDGSSSFDFFDPDVGDVHTFSIESGPTNGTVQLYFTVGGAFIEWLYTPDANYYGPDSFDFRVTDFAGASDIGTVFINVISVPDDPTVVGSEGDDVLDGTGDADIIYGGLGNDTLSGHGGADSFVFAESGTANADTILDFNAAEGDVIDIRDLLSSYSGDIADYIRATEGGGDTVIEVSQTGMPGDFEEVATLVGVTGLNLLDVLLIDDQAVT